MFRRYSERLLKKRLNKVNGDDIMPFSFNGIKTYAKVCDVYDGDTIKIVFNFKGEMIKYSARLYGIDTPEIRTKDAEEKKRGYEARDFLRGMILDKVVKVDLLKFDKYGRLLATVYNEKEENVVEVMIKNGHGKPYFGGTK